MSRYNLIEYSDNYSKASGSLWQYCKDIPAVDDDGNIVNSNGVNASNSLNFKAKITGQARDDEKKKNKKKTSWRVEIMVPLNYLSNFWRTLEMLLIKFEVNLILTYSENCVIVYTNGANQNVVVYTNDANQGATFKLKDTKPYVPVVTLSTQDMQNYYHN